LFRVKTEKGYYFCRFYATQADATQADTTQADATQADSLMYSQNQTCMVQYLLKDNLIQGGKSCNG
jgi:hypothetical protein